MLRFPIGCEPMSRATRNRIVRRIFDWMGLALASSLVATAQVSVTTYHYDNHRTGWNQSETTLTVTAVQSSSFGVLGKVALDDEVDTQPLIVPGVTITAGGGARRYSRRGWGSA